MKNTERPPRSTPDQSSHDEYQYELLKGHPRTDGRYKTDEQVRMEYLQLTDRLVHTITEGTSVTDSETGETTTRPYDNVIFLDKSARPVEWLVRALWPTLAKDANGAKGPVLATSCLIKTYMFVEKPVEGSKKADGTDKKATEKK